MFSYLKKKFTLIELIVVIAILGILAAIVIPNVGNMRDEADIARIKTDEKSIQTAVDLYATKNYNAVPSVNQPTMDKPEAIDFTKLYPKYIKKIPRNTLYYWVDYNHKVFIASTDAPINVVNTNGTLSWESNGTKYYVYEAVGMTESATQQIKFVGETNKQSMTGLVSGQKYLVQALDPFDNETAMVGSSYSGYTGTVVQNPDVLAPNTAPVAVIGMSKANPDNTDTVTFNYTGSTDADGNSIKSAEWKVDGVSVVSPNGIFAIGSHSVDLRVNDGRDWSAWVTKSFDVTKKNTPPVAVITLNPASPTPSTTTTFSYSQSTDVDGDSISQAEWKLDGTLNSNPTGIIPEGTHTIELRVFDGKEWSPWISQTFASARAITLPNGYTAINTVEDLEKVIQNPGGNFALMKNIDFQSPSSYATGIVNPKYVPGGEGWDSTVQYYGTFNGNGLVIKNFYSKKGGIFGNVAIKVQNLIMENVNIDTTERIGTMTCTGGLSNGLSGSGRIEKVAIISGTIKGSSYTGGIIGCSAGDGYSHYINNSYVMASVGSTKKSIYGEATAIISGGYSSNVSASNIYFAGTQANGTTLGHGLGGALYGNETYWDTTLAGTVNADFVNTLGKTTAEMKQASTFATWDKTKWNIVDGAYPTLKFQ